MALVTVQRSPSPSGSAETEEQDVAEADDSNLKSPRQRRRRSKSALKKLRKLFNTVRFVSKLKPCFSESYFTVKGAALILPQSDYEGAYARKPSKSQGDIQSHLQAMFSLLRPQDTIKVAVKLEGSHTRYLAVVSCIGRQDTEESLILGINLREKPEIGLTVPIWAHTKIELDGDGGFSIKSDHFVHNFKPVSVQAMWSAMQSLNKVVKIATEKLYIPRGLTHTWVGFYEAKLSKDTTIVSEWNVLTDIDSSYRIKSFKVNKENGDEEEFLKMLQTELKLVMMKVDLEEATCKSVREMLEKKLEMNLREYKSVIDLQMFEIMGQMDSPTLILDYLYLGSEWNASNLEELQENGVQYILNISREIDNFYPGILHYMNVREWDREQSDLMKYWEDTHKFINKARKRGSKTLVHCKMGISRSASTVMAYLMKEKKWSLQEAHDFTKAKRNIVNPNKGFWKQLETYEGILKASWNRKSFEKKAELDKTAKDMEDIPEGPEFHTAEDMLAVSLGKDLPEPSDLHCLHSEKDIEIGSRSADSTEESFPDQPSPDAGAEGAEAMVSHDPVGSKKKKKLPRFDSNIAESGDYLSSDSSEFTDSDSLSADEEENEAKVFQPIDIPGADIEGEIKVKKLVKPKSRRVKSESDKTLLTVEEGSVQSFSRESSVSKFKPDESWIKPEQAEKDEGNKEDEPEQVMEKDSQEDVVETDIDVNDKVEDVPVESVEIQNISDERTAESDTVEIEKVDDKPQTEEVNAQVDDQLSHEDVTGLEPYVKENIPWNLGKVRKQKQDIEEKFGAVAQNKNDPDTDQDKADKDKQYQIEETIILETETLVTVESVDDKNITETVDNNEKVELVIQSDESIKDLEDMENSLDTKKDIEDEASPVKSQKSKRSVYDLEEINLPEGIVKKTMMEIEERNKSSETESPRKKLQRSSSLKSKRVTPKAKNRDSERRKTCMAILSPTAYHRSDSNQSATGDDQAFLHPDHDKAKINLGPSEDVTLQASGETDEDLKTQTGTVKIYKYMGEELTVQEGMVRKQTLDIEHKAKETSKQQAIKTEKQQTELYSGNTVQSEDFSSTKQIPPLSSDETNQASPSENVTEFENSEPLQELPLKVENENVDESSLYSVESIKHTLYDRGKKIDEISLDGQPRKASVSDSAATQRSRTKSQSESRFDSETLQLIREIGSALMNSPAKSELDESVDDIQEGESLVNHYVRKIEKNIKISKKKSKRQIVIIEKDTACTADQRSNVPSGLLTEQQKQSICDSSEIKGETSWSSPVAKRTMSPSSSSHSDKSESPKSDIKIASPKWSPVVKKELVFDKSDTTVHLHDKEVQKPHNGVNTAVDIANTNQDGVDSMLKTSFHADKDKNTETSDSSENEGCSVKSLVGIFSAKSSNSITSLSDLPLQASPPPATTTTTTETGEVKSTGHGSPVSSSGRSPVKHDKPKLKHRQSEPAICLSKKSLDMFTNTLTSGGFKSIDKDIVLEESDTQSVDMRGNKTNISIRPTSIGVTGDLSGASGTNRRPGLRQSKTLSECEDSHIFSWEGKKVKTKKTHGKSHPLTKLEKRNSMDSIRSNPFYNTM